MNNHAVDVVPASLPSPAVTATEEENPYARLTEAMRRSNDAFTADLPKLLETHPRQAVAYAHGQRVGIGTSITELNILCLHELGLNDDEFIVRSITPDACQDVVSQER